MDCPKLRKLQMGRPDDYEVNDDDIEKVDYAIQEHLESRICMDGHQPPLISMIVMRTKQSTDLPSELVI